MKKRASRSKRALTPGSVPPAVAQASGSGPYLLFGNGYQAASASPNRGYLYWPTTDTRRQMSPLSRSEIHRRIQWLYWHFGFCRRLVHGMARLIGYVVPQPNVSDEEWNDLAFDAVMDVMGNAIIWDIQGKFDGLQGQVQDSVSIFRDGFALGVMTETTSARARLAYYEAHQLANPPEAKTGSGWYDGVLLSRSGAHIAYGLRDGEDPTRHTVVDAKDAIYFGAYDTRGQVHSISILTSAVLNMIDIVETRGSIKVNIKNHARMATAIETEVGGSPALGIGGFGGPTRQVAVTMPDGSSQTLNFELPQEGIQTIPLGPGQKVKLIADDRPSPNNMEFEKALMRDCTWGADLSYETLCDVSGITGPGIRFLNSELKRWIMLRRYPQVKRMNRMTVWALAKEMKSGRLRQPKLKPGEKWWNKIEYIGLADMDIDGGRTAQATLTDLRSGQSTWLDEWGTEGAFWKRRIKQSISETIFAITECRKQSEAAGLPDNSVTIERVFPDRFNSKTAVPVEGESTAPQPPARSTRQDAEDDPSPDDEP